MHMLEYIKYIKTSEKSCLWQTCLPLSPCHFLNYSVPSPFHSCNTFYRSASPTLGDAGKGIREHSLLSLDKSQGYIGGFLYPAFQFPFVLSVKCKLHGGKSFDRFSFHCWISRAVTAWHDSALSNHLVTGRTHAFLGRHGCHDFLSSVSGVTLLSDQNCTLTSFNIQNVRILHL